MFTENLLKYGNGFFEVNRTKIEPITGRIKDRVIYESVCRGWKISCRKDDERNLIINNSD
jgi:hypothetical protein